MITQKQLTWADIFAMFTTPAVKPTEKIRDYNPIIQLIFPFRISPIIRSKHGRSNLVPVKEASEYISCTTISSVIICLVRMDQRPKQTFHEIIRSLLMICYDRAAVIQIGLHRE